MAVPGDALTLTYKTVDGLAIYVDLYPPRDAPGAPTELPSVVYFHGGGLAVGNRQSWFPFWLHRRVTDSGMVFISADYRLIPPSTAHEILDDVKDLFVFLEHEVNDRIQKEWLAESRAGLPFRINPHALAVSGGSAGGLCAYLAAIHASPKPNAILSLYGMGGDMLTPQYLIPKNVPFMLGREQLNPKDFAEYLYPASQALQPTSDSPLAYHSPTYRIPGFPANPRMLLGRLYRQLGTCLDYYTGCHNPSLSASLRAHLKGRGNEDGDDKALPVQLSDPQAVLSEQLRQCIPTAHRHLFPQCMVTSDFPPTLLIHGSADTAVLVEESRNLELLLRSVGVPVELMVIEGKEHAFDYEPNAEEEFGQPGGLFDHAVGFLKEHVNNI
ncbi:alpha/beta-hydrolase [Trametes punicea]|nr:alpha/beta-hydrolase [Trametes punicea]